MRKTQRRDREEKAFQGGKPYLFGCAHVYEAICLIQLGEGIFSGEGLGRGGWDDFVDKLGEIAGRHRAEVSRAVCFKNYMTFQAKGQLSCCEVEDAEG